MNRNILFIMMITASMIVFGCTKQKEKGPIKIGVTILRRNAHIFIAKEKLFFKKNGVDVEIILNRDYLKIKDKFANHELDGAFMVFADAIYANDQGIDVRVVYVSDYSLRADVIVSRPEFKSLQDLRGKKISVEGINSFSHLFVLSVLEKNGIREGDVFIESVPAQDVVLALDIGEIAAGHIYGKARTEAKKKGYVFLANAGDVKGIITDVMVFNSEIIQKRGDDIKAVIKSLLEAKEFQQTNRKKVLQIMAKAIDDTEKAVSLAINAVDHIDLEKNVEVMHLADNTSKCHGEKHYEYLHESSKKIFDFFINRGMISGKPDPCELIENRFIKELLKEQGN